MHGTWAGHLFHATVDCNVGATAPGWQGQVCLAAAALFHHSPLDGFWMDLSRRGPNHHHVPHPHFLSEKSGTDFPGGPVVKNLCCNARNMSLIPGWETKILHVSDQLSLQATARDPEHHNERLCVLQQRPNVAKQILKKKKNNTLFFKTKKRKER